MESVCLSCIHYGYDNGCINGPVEQCCEPEDWCEEDMENFGTYEGCYRYEKRWE